MSRRTWLWIGGALLLLAGIGMAAWALLCTQAGLRLVLAGIAKQLPPGTQAEFLHGSGSLRDGFQLERLRWRTVDGELEATQVDVKLALEPLLGGGLVVESLAAEAARLQLPAGTGWPVAVPRVPRWPLAVELRDVRLPRLQIDGGHARFREVGPLQASVVLPVAGPVLFDASARAAGLDVTVFGRWGDAAPDAFDTEFHWQSVEPANAPASGSGRLVGAGQTLELTHQLAAPLQAGLTGKLVLSTAAPRWQARMDLPAGQRLPWQGMGGAWVLPALQFDLAGTSFDAWDISAEAPCALAGAIAARCSLQATGTLERLDVKAFTLLADKAKLDARGWLSWAQVNPRWRFEATASGIDPALAWPAFPGVLGFQVNGEGEGASGKLELSALAGELRGRRIAGEATAWIAEGSLRSASATLRAGRASLALSRAAQRPEAVEWRLDIPAMGDLLPEARGRLKGSGDWQGGFVAPVTRGKLAGSALALERQTLGSVSLDWNLDGRAPDRVQSLRVSARQLVVSGVPVETLEAALQGTLQRPRLGATLRASAAQLALVADGVRAGGGFRGRLLEATWQPATGAPLVLVGPGVLEGDGRGLSLADACWSGRGKLCMEASLHSERSWQLQFDARAFQPAAPWPAALRGSRLTGQLAVAGHDRVLDRCEGQLTLDLPGPLYATGASVVSLAPLAMRFRTAPAELGVTLETALVDPLPMPLAMQLAAPRRLPIADWSQWPLRGSLRGELASLAPLAEQSEELAEVEGAASLDLGVGGSLLSPTLSGGATVHLAHAHFTRFGVAMSDLRLEARGEPSGRLALDGGFRAGEGTVDLAGTLGLADGGLVADLMLEGERVRFIDLPEASAVASGKLKLHLEPRRARVEGALTVPQASLQMHERATATRRSADVVVEGERRKTSKAPPLDVAMTLTLGPEVALEAGGFSGRLAGQLELAATGDAPLRATGELRIEDGRYTQWGEALSLRNSRLLFADQPLSDPRVDARAEREVGGVTAGLRVTGRLREPEGRLYSNPALPDVDVLSYLVAGQPLSGASSTDARNLLGAAASMGLRGSGLLSQKVASAFGLDSLQVGTRSTARGPALDVGKFISPQLYVGYGAGLLERANMFRLRYLLGKRWSLEAETGSSSGADLLYTIER